MSSVKLLDRFNFAHFPDIPPQNKLSLELGVENLLLEYRPVWIKLFLEFFHKLPLLADLSIVDVGHGDLLAGIILKAVSDHLYQNLKIITFIIRPQVNNVQASVFVFVLVVEHDAQSNRSILLYELQYCE